MRDIFKSILNHLEKGQAVVRVAVMKSTGSTPRGAGAVMAVFSDGTIIGTIGGGLVEEASIRAGVRAFETGEGEIRAFDLTGQDAASLGMVCGGEMTVLIDFIDPGAEQVAFVTEILRRYEVGRKSLLTTMLDETGGVIRRGVWSFGDEQPSHWPEFGLSQDMRAPVARPHDGGTLFMEPIAATETIHFIGAGHVAKATARLAATLGFRVRVIDDRREFANTARFSEAHEVRVVADLGHCLPAVLDRDDYLVIMTRGHLHDRDVLEQALKTDAGYVGMIGSRKKKAAVYESLLGSGFTQDDLNRVHCPIGLAIGAETPEEIAVSIMAELIKVRAMPSEALPGANLL